MEKYKEIFDVVYLVTRYCNFKINKTVLNESCVITLDSIKICNYIISEFNFINCEYKIERGNSYCCLELYPKSETCLIQRKKHSELFMKHECEKRDAKCTLYNGAEVIEFNSGVNCSIWNIPELKLQLSFSKLVNVHSLYKTKDGVTIVKFEMNDECIDLSLDKMKEANLAIDLHNIPSAVLCRSFLADDFLLIKKSDVISNNEFYTEGDFVINKYNKICRIHKIYYYVENGSIDVSLEEKPNRFCNHSIKSLKGKINRQVLPIGTYVKIQ